MKRTILILAAVAMMAGSASAANIAFWDFNSTTNVTGVTTDLYRINPFGTSSAMTEYPRDLGVGTAEMSVWGTSDTSEGNLVGNNGDLPSPNATNNFGSFTGTTLNDIKGTPLAGGALSITGASNDGHFFLIELDDAIKNAVLTYATRGTATGYATHIIDYSTDNGATWTNLNSHLANKTSTWAVHTTALGDVFINTSGHESNLIKITVSTGGGTSGNNRFDNVLVTGDVVPEPATVCLLALGGLFLRRRSA